MIVRYFSVFDGTQDAVLEVGYESGVHVVRADCIPESGRDPRFLFFFNMLNNFSRY